MSRDEYLQGVEEGFIKDTIKKGWEKVKSFFKIGFKKIKDFLAVIDSAGNVLPVVSFQATIDRIADLTGVEVYAPSLISDVVVEAGGRGCEEKAPLKEDDEIYNYGPDGREEYIQWLKDEKYKEEPEYKNMMALTKMLGESAGVSEDEMNKLFESWDGIKKARATLIDNKELEGLEIINTDEFEELLNQKINDWSVRRGQDRVRVRNGVRKVGKVLPNIFVFGAPGIGKSTVPNAVVKKYNSNITNKEDMISIISINCANLKAGDFMMPTMPREVEITHEIEDFKDAFPQAAAALAELTPAQKKEVENVIYHSNQFKATDAPKNWLPSYRETGNDFIDSLLNDAANGGVYRKEGGKSVKTGGGGIILFDEFLRADPDIFGELMTFLLERRLNGWILGDRWTIIACSNRPQDDGKVADRWAEWFGAAKDRWGVMLQLVPDPEQWKEWARSKGCDELLLKFIFEESEDSMAGNEYGRWHSIVTNGAGDSQQVKPITPREWEAVFTKFNDYEIQHDYDDMSEMSRGEIEKVLKGCFDESFKRQILDWLEDHKNEVNLDNIMEDPEKEDLPAVFVKDQDQAIVLIQNLLAKFVSKFKNNPGDCTDKQFANIITWLGIHYKEDMFSVQSFMEGVTKDVFKNSDKDKANEFSLHTHVDAMLTLLAAYPEKDIEDVVAFQIKRSGWPEDSMEIIKDKMRKFFPWRISGDKINFVDDLSIEDEPKKDEE